MDFIKETLKELVYSERYSLMNKTLGSLLLILVVWLLRLFILRLVDTYSNNPKTKYSWRKYSGYITFLITLLFAGRIWFGGLESLTTFLGLISAGIAIALKDLILNYVGWVYIIFKQPFRVGDRIQVGSFSGDVIDISLFNFALMEIPTSDRARQSTGRVLYLPNSLVWNSDIANANEGFNYIWNELEILLTFESNWRKAKEKMTEIINEHSAEASKNAKRMLDRASKKHLIFYSYLTPIVYTSVMESGILLTIRYLCHPQRRRKSEEYLWEEMLDFFQAEKDIDFAYPTYRITGVSEKPL